MFRCERCGSSFTPRQARGLESCPRCREQDEVRTPLVFKLFSSVGSSPPPVERCRRAVQDLGGRRIDRT